MNFTKYIRRFAMLMVIFLCWSVAYSQQTINVDFQKKDKVYEGIGALSAGASSRLLIEYPEPYRSQILDLLFKPRFGASLQHLKVEIGGDVNSTAGTEPSHARTREEFDNPKPEYFNRGYEWWLMEEAKKRNPNIYLDCLEWGAPGWIGDGKFYSNDNIDYMISFIKGAKLYHNLKIDFTGIWNEKMYDTEFIKNLRKKLDDNGLNEVKIVAADLANGKQWVIADDMKKDEELQKAIAVIGDHYPERDNAYNSSDNAKSFGKPIWNSEGGPWKGNWQGFRYLAKMYNRDYIEGTITKNITWSLITSYYENLSLPNSGLMMAKTPWSGFFEIEPALWAAAHTSQFAEPGWMYIDSGCGYLSKKGSFVTLASNKNDVSLIVESMDASEKQEVTFKFAGDINGKVLNVWRSQFQGEAFKQLSPVKIKNNELSITIEPKCLYSITTTTGQQKGWYGAPNDKPFPFPYLATFDDAAVGSTPQYFMDQGGAFEVVARTDKKGNALRQVITRRAIEWEGEVFNNTVIGDTAWTDYSVKSEIYFTDPYSYATLYTRYTEAHRAHTEPEAYGFKLYSSGKWELSTVNKILSKGFVKIDAGNWQNMSVTASGNNIKAFVNGIEVASVTDTSYTHGMAGLGSSFSRVDFDNFEITR